jgi:hypothetical protein
MQDYLSLRPDAATLNKSAANNHGAETRAGHHEFSRFDEIEAKLRRVRRSGYGISSLCPVPAHNDHQQSFSARQVENVILLFCFAGCSLAGICAALGLRIRDLFLGPGNHSNGSNVQHHSDQQRLAYAREHFWRPSRVALHTIVEAYLQSRELAGPIPLALRFIPLLPHKEYGWPFPAMVAGIQTADGRFTGVSVTWLCADGSDKAPVEPVRKVFGPYQGGAVRLSDRPAERIYVAEGIETALSIQQATGIPTWAALSARNLPHLELPESIHEVTIAADPDDTGEAAARTLAQRLDQEGREVAIAHTGQLGSDFNDLLRR